MKSEMTSTTVSSLKRSLYLTDGPKTFSNESTLPALPVPDLKHTIELYLNTVKPLVSEKEYQTTVAIAERFLNGVGPKLQEAVVRKSENNKNWVCDHFCYILLASFQLTVI
jgi:carnitine palmitoyltransferase I, putative